MERKDFLLSFYKSMAKQAMDFIENGCAQSDSSCIAKTKIAKKTWYKDGVYLLYSDGRLEAFDGENSKSGNPCVAIVDNGAFFGLSDKDVEGCLVPDLEKLEIEHSRYFQREVDALNDRDCVAGTKHLMDCGCEIEIPEGFYIPSLAQLVLIIRHIDEVNEALEYIGHEPIKKDDWYWSSTEYSAPNAWYVGTSSGNVYANYKSPASNYVRPVSAFMLSI